MATVLLVDDEKSIRTTLAEFLKDAGHEVIEAADAAEAIAWVDRKPLDVALLDILLGKTTGLDVVRHIRDRQPHVRCILITAQPNFMSASEAIRLRVFDYLVKPAGKVQVVAIVAAAAVERAREAEYALLLRERERFAKDMECQVKARTAELTESTANLHALAARLQVIREDERVGLARELHDDFGQNLTALQIDLNWMDGHLRTDQPPDIARLMGRIAGMTPLTERLIRLTQTVCASLRPGVLDDLGLLAAIEWVAEDCETRTGMACALSLPNDDPVLDPSHALALFRIVQEALTNVARHAQATHVNISLQVAPGELLLQVKDNGRGFSPDSSPVSKSLGVLGMRERAFGFRGTVDILSAPGQGTTLQVRMPLA